MKVALVHSRFRNPALGAERYVLRLGASLQDRGHDVVIITSVFELDDDRFDVITLDAPRPYDLFGPEHHGPAAKVRWHLTDTFESGTARQLHAALDRTAPDVVHSHIFQGIGSRSLSVTPPHVHTVHEFGLIDPSTKLVRADLSPRSPNPLSRLRSRWHARLLRNAVVVYPSAATERAHREHGFVAAHQRIIEHGWIADPTVPRTHADHDPVRFLYLGALAEHKGVRLLLEAWHLGVRGATLTIGGEGAMHDEVVTAAAADPTISYAGYLSGDAVDKAYADHDVFVFPSAWPETYGLVVAEAVDHELPIVALDRSCSPLTIDGVNAIIATMDAAALNGALCSMLDPARRFALAQGSARLRPSTGWERHVDRIEALYGEMATGSVGQVN